MKVEQIECSETSAYKIQMPGNHPEENIQHTEHGESLKWKILNSVRNSAVDILDFVRHAAVDTLLQFHSSQYGLLLCLKHTVWCNCNKCPVLSFRHTTIHCSSSLFTVKRTAADTPICCLRYKYHYYHELAGVPAVVRDDESREPVDGVILWYKEKGLQKYVETCRCETEAILPAEDPVLRDNAHVCTHVTVKVGKTV
jgi:hypothetical protein